MPLNLPQPTPVMQAHADRVRAYIAAQIKQNGAMTFAQYMQEVLYAPGLGYYSAGAHKLGEAGDFVTAPELSPLFSRCVAKQCRQVLRALDGGDILELGAGSGIMALDILRELKRQHCLPRHYYILEVSADLRDRQRQLFSKEAPEFLSTVAWLDRLPADLSGVIVANEVMDAMPVHKVKHTRSGWKEFYVNQTEEGFLWELNALSSDALQKQLEGLSVDGDYETECSLALRGWIASLSKVLTQGLILLIDYGFPEHEYYHHDRHMGTIMCHYQHRAHVNPLVLTGIQDITSHVNFTAVAQAAVENDLSVSGFTNQANFLMNCDLLESLSNALEPIEQMKQSNQVKQLMLPSEMGELFKAMALTKEFGAPLLGFRQANQVARL